MAVVPPPASPAASATAAADTTSGAARPPAGPVLYYVHRVKRQSLMVPVAEIAGATLRTIRTGSDWRRFDTRYIAADLRQGSEFTLFRTGRRVGTFVVQHAVLPDSSLCPRLPVADGLLELVADADTMSEFLAMARRQAIEPSHATASARPGRKIDFLGPILAERLLRARKAPLPSNWRYAMKQLFPFPIQGSAKPGFAGSLLVSGTIAVGPDDIGSSLLFLATPRAGAVYDTAYAEYADFAHGGKLATRVIDFLDWNRDGQVELLTQSYGSAHTWFGALGDVGGRWRSIFSGRCATGSAIPTALPLQHGDTIAGSPAPRP